MTLVASTWQDTGRNVIGLAPSAAAASILSDEIGATSHTIDSLTFTWRGLNPANPVPKTLAALPVQIRPGDMLLVDEAGMASTENLAALTEIAQEAGAIVRLIGDPKQLAAVESGGLFADLANTPGTPELREVMRMGADTEQAEATLELREGNTDALHLYSQRGWVHGGLREQMLTDAVQAFIADTKAGRKSLVIASRNADVDTLNEVIRSSRIADGLVDDTRTTRVARGDTVGVGDTVIARLNKKLFTEDSTYLGRVVNGQLFTVTGITGDGALAVRDLGTGQDILIPADYAAANMHLGYATTIHRAQGATVDTTHAVLDSSVDRSGLYVAMTRGKHENRAYAVCEPAVDLTAEDAHMHSAGDRAAPTAIEVLATILARDTHQASATRTLREELEESTSPERLESLYRHGVDLAAEAFTAATLPTYIDALPRAYGHQIEAHPEQHDAIMWAWTAAAKAGIDPREHWTGATTGLDTADSPGAVIAHRLRHVMTEETSRGELPPPPPVTTTSDPELADWLATTHRDLAEAPAEQADDAADSFAASYLAHRAADRANGRAVCSVCGPAVGTTTGPSVDWGPATGPDSSADLW